MEAGKSGFKNGPGFPNEQFVVEVLEWQFDQLQLRDDLSSNDELDLAAVNVDETVRWRIEAKGDTGGNCGNDFHTCLGQLLRKIRDPAHMHGVALPDIERYRTCIGKVAPFIREALNLHWIMVREDESLTIEAPGGTLLTCVAPSRSVTTPKRDNCSKA